jgi:hypothetical protein
MHVAGGGGVATPARVKICVAKERTVSKDDCIKPISSLRQPCVIGYGATSNCKISQSSHVFPAGSRLLFRASRSPLTVADGVSFISHAVPSSAPRFRGFSGRATLLMNFAIKRFHVFHIYCTFINLSLNKYFSPFQQAVISTRFFLP